jgi:hypothetical protein
MNVSDGERRKRVIWKGNVTLALLPANGVVVEEETKRGRVAFTEWEIMLMTFQCPVVLLKRLGGL